MQSQTPKHTTFIIIALLLLFASNSLALQGIWDGKMHIVYHVSEAQKVNFAMNNIRNHLNGGGGETQLDIVLVIHGPALEEFDQQWATDKTNDKVAGLQAQGVQMIACGNTMKAQKLSLEDLPEGFQVASEGGVTRIAALQSLGYLYIRP